ncbi:MAG: hypothetical protein M5R36_05555 [Deltaproteobacteria bacterium]|nr:hypothetical protein [Deltaproteobacteria bacterium]
MNTFLNSVAEGTTDITLPNDRPAGATFCFLYEPDLDHPVSDRPLVRAYWEKRMEPVAARDFNCLVTGEPCAAEKDAPGN